MSRGGQDYRMMADAFGANAFQAPGRREPDPAVPALRASAPFAAHNAAIDRLCSNMLGGDFTLNGVREEYQTTLEIERQIEREESL